MTKRDAGNTKHVKPRIDVEMAYTEDLKEINISLWSTNALSGQDIINAISETLLLKYDNFDLDSVKDEDIFDS